MSSKQIGILGGTFDPVHKAHTDIALAAINQFTLEEVWFLPERSPRYKPPVAAYNQRLDMLNLACQNHPKLKVVDLPEPNHDLTSLKNLILKNPNCDFTLIAGLDLISYFDRWENYTKFLRLANFMVVNRPGTKNSELTQLIKRLGPNSKNFNYTTLNFKPSDISSTQIRTNKPTEHLINPKVQKYITKYNIY